MKQVQKEEVLEYVERRIEEKLVAFEKKTDMLNYIENDCIKLQRKKHRKTQICLDFEKETPMVTLFQHNSVSSMKSRVSPSGSPLTSQFTQSINSMRTFDLHYSNTERSINKKSLPHIAKPHRRIFSDAYTQQFVPSSLNSHKLERFQGLSIVSLNRYKKALQSTTKT